MSVALVQSPSAPIKATSGSPPPAGPGVDATPTAPAAPSTPAPPAPPAATGELGQSPAYLAYMRTIGLRDADAQAAAQQGAARLQAKLSNGIADTERTQQAAGYALGNRLEASGQGTSSVGQYDAAHQAAAYAAREEAMRQAYAENLSNLLTNLAARYQAGGVGLTDKALLVAPQESLAAAQASNYGVGV